MSDKNENIKKLLRIICPNSMQINQFKKQLPYIAQSLGYFDDEAKLFEENFSKLYSDNLENLNIKIQKIYDSTYSEQDVLDLINLYESSLGAKMLLTMENMINDIAYAVEDYAIEVTKLMFAESTTKTLDKTLN